MNPHLTTGQALFHLLFPSVCPACQQVRPLQPIGLCPPCLATLADNIRHNYCRGCGTSAGPFAAANDRCSSCKDQPRTLAGVVRVGSHTGSLRQLLLAFKFGHDHGLNRTFGLLLARTLQDAPWFEQVDALLAVPTTRRRRMLGRPYIADALAQRAAKTVNLPVLPLLRRVRGGPSQVGLSRTQRMENVKGAFRLARGVSLNRAVLCLVDDVATTGATLAECAKVLKRAGAAKVFAAVACKNSRHDAI
ncbi:MAG: double zinc ribbon domain-containing protein [Phycisphaerae bacterium]